MNRLLFILIGTIIVFSAYSQNNPPAGKKSIEIGFGLNAFGPAGKMFNLMEDYGLDDLDSGPFIIWGDPHMHPHYQGGAITFQLLFTFITANRTSFGFLLNHSFLRQVQGYDLSSDNHLSMRFSSTFFGMPIYKLALGKYWELHVAPALVINSGSGKAYSSYVDRYIKPSFGVISGLGFNIWNGDATYGKICIQYLVSIPGRIRMGPFTAENNWNNKTVAIPESKYGFGHLILCANIGFHIQKE